MDAWLDGLKTAFVFKHLLILCIGSVLGITAGAVPGVNGTMAIALAIPVTYTMGPVAAMFLLISLYCSSVMSGSISAILFRIPGAPEAAATVMDGHAMVKKGLAGEALGWSISASVFGGIFGSIVLCLVAPQLARVALEFGPPEYFALAFMGLSVVSSLGGQKSVVKALISALIGLFIACIGIDKISGAARFTFNLTPLLGGIDFVPTIIGLFAVSEVLSRLKERQYEDASQNIRASANLPGWRAMFRLKWLLLRSSIIGTIIGILPGVGATTASFVGLSESVRWSKHPERYGTGIPEGIAAPESANNAAAPGAMVPLLTLGIPGSAATALMIGAMLIHGIKPGPLMFMTDANLIYAIFVGMFLANIMIIFFAKVFIRYFSRVIELPYAILCPAIVIFCIVGVFAIRNNFGDIWIMLFFGVMGYFMEKYSYPLAPLILGVVLGPIAEESLRQAFIMDYNIAVLFSSKLSAVLMILGILSVFSPLIRKLFAKNSKKEAAA